MRRLYHKHKQKIDYLLVGGWNTVFGYFAFVALYYLFRQWIHYLILVVIANVFSITNAYIGYKIFVFKTKGNYLREYLRFYAVYSVLLMLNLVLLPLVVEIFRVNPVIGQAFVMGFNVIISYVGHKHFSFKLNILIFILAGQLVGGVALAENRFDLFKEYYAWNPLNQQTRLWMRPDSMILKSEGGFPAFYNQNMLSVLFDKYDILTFRMRTDRGGIGSVYWSDYINRQFNRQRSHSFYLGKPGKWKEYYLYLAGKDQDLGRLDYLLLNPFSGPGEAEIKDLRFIKGGFVEKLRAGWQEFFGPYGREVVGYTINTMPSPTIFGRSAYVYIYWILGLLIVFLAGHQLSRRRYDVLIKQVFAAVMVFWFLLEASTLHSNWKNLQNDLPLIGKSLEQKRMLVNQGDFYAFVQFCREKVPPDAHFDTRIPAFYNDIKANYYLYPREYEKKAEYLIVYDKPVEQDIDRQYRKMAEFREGAYLLTKKD